MNERESEFPGSFKISVYNPHFFVFSLSLHSFDYLRKSHNVISKK